MRWSEDDTVNGLFGGYSVVCWHGTERIFVGYGVLVVVLRAFCSIYAVVGPCLGDVGKEE